MSAADLDRIRTALDHAEKVLLGFKSGDTEALCKTNRDVVTAADLERCGSQGGTSRIGV